MLRLVSCVGAIFACSLLNTLTIQNNIILNSKISDRFSRDFSLLYGKLSDLPKQCYNTGICQFPDEKGVDVQNYLRWMENIEITLSSNPKLRFLGEVLETFGLSPNVLSEKYILEKYGNAINNLAKLRTAEDSKRFMQLVQRNRKFQKELDKGQSLSLSQ